MEANSSKRKPLQMIIVSPKPPALDGKMPVQDISQYQIHLQNFPIRTGFLILVRQHEHTETQRQHQHLQTRGVNKSWLRKSLRGC